MRLSLWAALIWMFLAFGAGAQSLVDLARPKAAEPLDNLTHVIEEAARNGLGVIVIDPQGNLLSPSGTPPADPEPRATGMGMGGELMRAQTNADAFRDALFERLSDLPAAFNEVLFILRASSPDGTIWAYVEVLLLSLMLFAIGMLAQHYIYGRHIARHFVMPLIKENPQGYSEKMPFLAVRFLAGVIGTLFSMVVAYAIGFAVFGSLNDSALQYTAVMVNIGYFSARFITGLWRMILSPYLTQYRIPNFSDRDARRLHIWLSVVATAGVFAALFSEWVHELGLNDDVYIFMMSFLSFLMVLLNIVMVLVNRRPISAAILNGRDVRNVSWPARVISRWWLAVVVVYLLFGWGELVYDHVLGIDPGVPLGAAAYLILTVILVVYGIINFLIERGFARARAIRDMNATLLEPGQDGAETSGDEGQAVALATTGRIETFEDLTRRIAGILAIVAGLGAFLTIWQPNTAMIDGSLPDRTMDVVVIVFLGYIIYNVFRIWIDGKIREEQGDEEPAELGDEGSGSSASRLATLLPLFRNIVLIVILVTVALIVLMELGVNVGPLFAGAGIVGVAIGFGSQTLVRDIFSGAFFLFDDAFRKGEYIEIGDVRGTVEKISVRSFQLRHHLGKLHTIPFGEIQVLTNYSRDWVMMKLPLRVTYETNVEKVRKLIKKLGQELLKDPEIGPDFLQPLKSQGVIEMQDSAMIIRVKFMTKPGDQWVIRKRVFQEIRDLFEREGIKFAHREVTVRLADEPAKPLTEAQKETVMAGAQVAIELEDVADADGGDDR